MLGASTVFIFFGKVAAVRWTVRLLMVLHREKSPRFAGREDSMVLLNLHRSRFDSSATAAVKQN